MTKAEEKELQDLTDIKKFLESRIVQLSHEGLHHEGGIKDEGINKILYSTPEMVLSHGISSLRNDSFHTIIEKIRGLGTSLSKPIRVNKDLQTIKNELAVYQVTMVKYLDSLSKAAGYETEYFATRRDIVFSKNKFKDVTKKIEKAKSRERKLEKSTLKQIDFIVSEVEKDAAKSDYTFGDKNYWQKSFIETASSSYDETIKKVYDYIKEKDPHDQLATIDNIKLDFKSAKGEVDKLKEVYEKTYGEENAWKERLLPKRLTDMEKNKEQKTLRQRLNAARQAVRQRAAATFSAKKATKEERQPLLRREQRNIR